MNESTETSDLVKALILASKEFSPIKQNCTVSISGRAPFTYGNLAECYNATKEALEKNGLYITNQVVVSEGFKRSLIAKLRHTSGQWISSTIDLPDSHVNFQETGKGLTYMKRYLYCALLGITEGEEVNGPDLDKTEPIKQKKYIDMEEHGEGLSAQDICKMTLILAKIDEFPKDYVKLQEYFTQSPPKKSPLGITGVVSQLIKEKKKFLNEYNTWLDLNSNNE